MDSNSESNRFEGENIIIDKSEFKTHEIGSVETTGQPIGGSVEKDPSFGVTESIGNSLERGDPVMIGSRIRSNEQECDANDDYEEEEENSGYPRRLIFKLEQVRRAMKEDTSAEINLLSMVLRQDLRTDKVKPKKAAKKSVESVELNKDIIDLSDLNLGPLSFKPIVESPLSYENLTRLILPNNRLGIYGLEWISHLFTITSRITHLNFANNYIGARGSEYIENILKNGSCLEFLDLSSNGLSDAQLIAISQELNNTILKELNLSDNNFRSESGKSLGQCLSLNEKLRKLDLSFNKLREGASDILTGIWSNNSLKILDLSSNFVTWECAPELDKLLATNQCLEELHLVHNFITKEGVVVFRKSLKTNQTLRVLSLGCNPLFHNGCLALLMAVSSRQNKLELLDLTGIRVDMPFFKLESKIEASGRNLVVKHGNRIGCLTCLDRYRFAKTTMSFLICLANHHGISLKAFLQETYAKSLDDKEAQTEIPEAQEIEKTAATQQVTMDDVYSRMEIPEFVEMLVNSSIKVPEDIAQKLAEEFADDRNTVNIQEMILKIPYGFDDFEVVD